MIKQPEHMLISPKEAEEKARAIMGSSLGAVETHNNAKIDNGSDEISVMLTDARFDAYSDTPPTQFAKKVMEESKRILAQNKAKI